MWSAVVTIFATSDGCRNVAGETIVPRRRVEVTAASPQSVPQASSDPRSGDPGEVEVVVRAEQLRDPVLLTGATERLPLRPGDPLLTFDHQA